MSPRDRRVSAVARHVRRPYERLRARRRARPVCLERRLEPAPALGYMLLAAPELRERPRQAKRELLLAGLLQPVERGAEVVELGLEPVQPGAAAVPVRRRAVLQQVRLRLLGESEEVLRVAAAKLLRLARRLQPLARVLADRLQHPEALAGVPREALAHERLEGVELGARDRLGGAQRAAAGEHGETGKEPPLFLVEQLVRPLDRGAQGLLPGLRVAAAPEQVEALLQPLQDLGRGEHARARRGQLDRERQAVQAPAELRNLVARLELRSGAEEPDRLRLGQRRGPGIHPPPP